MTLASLRFPIALLSLALVFSTWGCGGTTDGTGAPVITTDGACTFGEVARASGFVGGTASVDGTLVFAANGGQVFTSKADGTVAPIDVDATEGQRLFALKDDVVIAWSSSPLSSSAVSRYHVADGSITMLDDVSSNGGIVRSAATDGTTIAWVRWLTPDDSTMTLERWSPAGRTSETIGEEVTGGVQSLAIAGDASYGIFHTEVDGGVIGRIPTGSQTKQVLVTLGDQIATLVGADDAHVVYTTQSGDGTDWTLSSVPTNGGPPVVLATWSAAPTFVSNVSLFGSDVWWQETRSDAPDQVDFFRAPVDGSTPATQAMTTGLRATNFTVDACGLVYGTQSGSLYREKP